MTCWRFHGKNLLVLDSIVLLAAVLAQLRCPSPAHAQSLNRSFADVYTVSTTRSSLASPASPASDRDLSTYSASSEYALPEAPEPAGAGGNPEHYTVAPPAQWHQPPFSRIGIGADLSLLGVGLKSATVLTRYFDARFMGNFFHYNTGRIEVEGFNANGNLHLASAAASLDWYPFDSIWRLSPGLIFFNGNQISAVLDIAPGTSFDLNKQTFYSAAANPATGAMPLTGSAILGLHTNRPAFTIAGGFGKFIPRSNRHWSFPSEFGVAFTGAPSINLNLSGSTCLDAEQTQCGNLSDPTNPVTIQFDNALQASLTKWRKSLNQVQVYPILSYSVVYSFNVR
jgi:hypothetical protein